MRRWIFCVRHRFLFQIANLLLLFEIIIIVRDRIENQLIALALLSNDVMFLRKRREHRVPAFRCRASLRPGWRPSRIQAIVDSWLSPRPVSILGHVPEYISFSHIWRNWGQRLLAYDTIRRTTVIYTLVWISRWGFVNQLLVSGYRIKKKSSSRWLK